MADLKTYGVSQMTFNWDAKDTRGWNCTVAVLVVKHWRFARDHGAFNNKHSVNPTHNTISNCIGLVLRWLCGRAEDIRLHRLDAEKLRQKEQQRKKKVVSLVKYYQYLFIQLSSNQYLKLFGYREETVERHLTEEAKQLLPDADCCSDTEWDPEAIEYQSLGVPWRSQQYGTFLHGLDNLSYHYKASVTGPTAASRRFDQCRKKARLDNPKAPVCIGLPRNCYDPLFLSNLVEDELAALKMKPILGLLNSLPAFMDSLLGN